MRVECDCMQEDGLNKTGGKKLPQNLTLPPQATPTVLATPRPRPHPR